MLAGWVLCLLLAASPPGAAAPVVDLVVQTDSRGEIAPCHCVGSPAGGFSRRSEVFKLARASGFPTLVLEGGDFLPDLDDSLAGPLDAFLPELLPDLGYDAVTLGERELFRGPAYVARLAAGLPLVSANVTVDGAAVAPAVRWFDAGGLRVAVTGVTDPLLFYAWPGAFEGEAAAFLVSDPVEALAALRDSFAAADVVVVLDHAGLDRILEDGPRLDFVDVIVQTHEPALGKQAGRAGEAFVVEPGPRSRQIVRARLERLPAQETAAPRTPRGVSLSSIHVWELKRTERFDTRVEARVQTFLDSLEGP